jgi:hypothetical protein
MVASTAPLHIKSRLDYGDPSPFSASRIVILCVLGLALISRTATAQTSAELRAQDTDAAAPRRLTPEERNALGDPFFRLVLRDHPDATTLDATEKLLQPDVTKRRVFVVDENIEDPGRPQTRRAVLTYDGTNPNLPDIQLTSNVMLSVFFSDTEFGTAGTNVEAWGWDADRKRYNFYKLDRPNTTEPLSWKFRCSSDGADALSISEPTAREGKCIRCHINGAPVMKELLFPWNNWHSFQSQTKYLLPDGASPWPVAKDPHLARSNGQSGGLAQAQELEKLIIEPIRRFNQTRIRARFPLGMNGDSPKTDANGFAQVDQARRLLRPLFVTTEFNLISSSVKSGLHPIPAPSSQGPSKPVSIPSSFFLNSNLLHGGGSTSYQSFAIVSADFSDLPPVAPNDYKTLIGEKPQPQDRGGVKIGGKPGDADFAWFVPEPSHVDNEMIDQLMRFGVITREFAAAVLAVDLESPVFSKDREGLLVFVPDQFRFKPAPAPRPNMDELTTKVIAALQASNPTAGSPQMTFLQLLKDPAAVAKLLAQVDAYHARVKSRLSDPQTKMAELRRLQRKAVQARRDVEDHVIRSNLDETGAPGRLLPLP